MHGPENVTKKVLELLLVGMKIWEEWTLECDLFDASHVLGYGAASLYIWLPMLR